MPKDIYLRKNLRESSDSSNQPSDRSECAQRLQEHRNRHQRLTGSPKDKALMTTSMQMKEEKQKEEAQFQAIQEYIGNMSTIAARRGVTSDGTLPRKKVPPRYQERLSGAGPEKAEEYFNEMTRGLSPSDKQIVREKFYGYTKTRNEYTIQQRNKYWKLYNEPDESDHPQEKYGQSSASSERQGTGREAEDNRSARLSSREVSEAESESEEPSYKGDSNESTLVPLDGDHPYFPVRYPSDSGREIYDSGLTDRCVVNTTITILHDQGIYNFSGKQVDKMYKNREQKGSNRRYIQVILNKYGRVPYEYKKHLSLSDLQDKLKTGHSIIASISDFTGEEKSKHSVVVDKIETDSNGNAQYVHIRDSGESDPYKVTIGAWKKAWNHMDVVPVILGSDDDSQEGTSYSPPPQAPSWDHSNDPYPPSYDGGYDSWRY